MYSKTGAHLGLREDRALAASLAWHLNQWLTQAQVPRPATDAPTWAIVRDPVICDSVYRDAVIQEESVASRAAG